MVRVSSSRSIVSVVAASILAAVVGAPHAGAQVVVSNTLHRVTGDPLAPDYCGVSFIYHGIDATYTNTAGGASIADFDNDGLLDIFFPDHKGFPNKLYHNVGNATFVDEAAARGVADPTSAGSMGLFFDYDLDGDRDLLVLCHLSKPGGPSLGPKFKLFRNSGAAGGYTFFDVTSQAGFALGATPKATLVGWVSGGSVGDYNRDGYPDLFATWNGLTFQDQWRVMRSEPNPVAGDPHNPAYSPRKFVDATPGSAFAVIYPGDPWQGMWVDLDRDGWPDLSLNIDYGLDLFWHNNHDGTFTEECTSVGLNNNPTIDKNQMGMAWGDYDFDGDLDVHHTNLGLVDDLFRNDTVGPALAFTEIGSLTGLNNSTFGWGDLFFDFDNDGDLDHTALAGFEHLPATDYWNTVHLNLWPETLESGDVKWADVTDQLVEYTYWGLPAGDLSRALTQGDLDNDGDVDLVATNTNSELAEVFLNTLSPSANGWMELDLVESPDLKPTKSLVGAHGPAQTEPGAHRTATSLNTTGAQVWLRFGGLTQYREIFTGSSFLAQESPRLHFGLGPDAANTYQWTVVRWYDGSYQIARNLALDAINTIQHSRVDDAGDLDGDGHLTETDQAMLALLVADEAAFVAAYPNAPGLVTGDIDGNNVLDAADIALWSTLPPH